MILSGQIHTTIYNKGLVNRLASITDWSTLLIKIMIMIMIKRRKSIETLVE